MHASPFLRGQIAVAIVVVERRPGIGEDGGGVAPVEHAVENEAKGRCEMACIVVLVLHVSVYMMADCGLRVCAPVQAFFEGTKPIPTSTQQAQVVRP